MLGGIMEENNKYIQVSNLPTVNIKSQLNLHIDSNTHIKQVINIETCLIETQIEPMSNKALIKGSIGVKVIYVDMDNMFNSLSDTINFSENIIGDNITSDCKISVVNSQFVADFNNDDKILCVNIDGMINCFCSTNNNLNIFNPSSENLICKKSIMPVCSCIETISKNTTFDFDFTLDVKINKILSYDSKVIIEDSKCCNGYILVSGKIINTIIYEIEGSDNNCIKICNNTSPFKCEIEANNSDSDCESDLSAYINLDSTQITTEINEQNTQFGFEYCMVVNGYVYKNMNVAIVEDAYSTQNFIEPIVNTHKFCNKTPYVKINENVDTEITLADEISVDEILGMVNTSSSITQHTIKENAIIIEGVINGNLLYLDENREIKHLSTQLPYSISIKKDFSGEICGSQLSITPTSCKCKIKRGNTLIVDYELCITGNFYTHSTIELINDIKLGKVLDYGDTAFQIYIARANESEWELCKRLHINKEQLAEFNNTLPSTYVGGEKIIVYR